MNSEFPKLKIIIVGDTGVGKTTILTKYIKKTFTKTNLSTIGSELYIKEVEIEGQKLRCEIWDTPGQVRFKTITKSFIQKTNIGIMVCDITKQVTFDNLNEWYNTFKNIIDVNKCVIGIAANKSDLFEKEVVHLNQIHEFGKSINCKVFSTTATQYECLENMFLELIKDYYDEFIKEKEFIIDDLTLLEGLKKPNKKQCC